MRRFEVGTPVIGHVFCLQTCPKSNRPKRNDRKVVIDRERERKAYFLQMYSAQPLPPTTPLRERFFYAAPPERRRLKSSTMTNSTDPIYVSSTLNERKCATGDSGRGDPRNQSRPGAVPEAHQVRRGEKRVN